MKMYNFFVFFVAFCLLFSGCASKEPEIKYDIIAFSDGYKDYYESYAKTADENEKYILYSDGIDFFSETDETFLQAKSLTLFSDYISEELAIDAVEYCKKENIPLFFICSDIPYEICDDYDKAYCIYTDYIYAAEKLAEKVKEIWKDSIEDINSDDIFTFTVFEDEDNNKLYDIFYNNFLNYIELLGIPYEEFERVKIARDEDFTDYSFINSKTNEAIIFLSDNLLNEFLQSYEDEESEICILGITTEKKSEKDYIHLCFIDYSQCFEARAQILHNLSQKIYPFTDMDYPIIGKKIIIEPLV